MNLPAKSDLSSMKFARSLNRLVHLLTGIFASASLLAQESPYDLEKAGWYVRTGAYLQMGMSVSVSREVAPALITPGVYDNGYVQEDISQGAQGLTWNWGYLDESQLIGGKLELNRAEGLSTVDSLDGFEDGMIFGPEVLVGFEFYQFEIRRRNARFGFELGLRFGTYSGTDQATVQSDVLMKRDRFDLGGVVPPLPPYVGFPNVAGPLISLTPEPQSTLASRASSSLATDLVADFYTGRFGAWLTVPLSENWTVAVSGGFTSIYAYGTAKYTQSTVYENAAFASVTETANTSEGDWLPGVYLQLRGEYRILPWMSAYATAEWAHNGMLRINGLEYQAQFDFGSTFGVSGGLQFSF